MKRMIVVILFCITSLVVFSSTSQAAPTCSFMEVTIVGESIIWLKNVDSTQCGSIAVNGSQWFVYHPDKHNKQLAIALSAMAMNKKVWVDLLGDSPGSIINILAIR